MIEHQQQPTVNQKEFIETFAKLLREHYEFLYEQVLSGQSSLLLAKIAARLDMTEDILINEVVASEADRILKDIEMASSHMQKLKEMVDKMTYAP